MYELGEIVFPYRVNGIHKDLNRFRYRNKSKSFRDELEKKLEKEENSSEGKEKNLNLRA